MKAPNKVTAANADLRFSFRFAVDIVVLGVAEFCR
jgi:hypothetical protein